MATFTKTMSGDNRYSIELEVKEKSTNPDANTSVVQYTFKAIKSSGGGFYTSSKTNVVKVTLDGEEIVNKKIAYDFSANATITLASGTKTITHNSDGTKTMSCKGYFKDNENSLGSATASGSLTLTQLHKPPEITITDISELNTTLIYYRVPHDTFVDNISKKSLTIRTKLYDEQTTNSSITLSSGNVTNTTSTTDNPATASLDMANAIFTNSNGYAYINVEVTDNLNAKGTTQYRGVSYIAYTKPTLVASNLTSKRAGQLTGDITLKANGTYYNGSIGTLTIQPIVYYRYRQITTPESSWGNWTLASTPTTDNGTWSLNQTISSVFNYQNAYEIEVYCTDNLIQTNNADANNTTITIPTYITKVLIGEATWTEYADRVDFKKISIKGTDPFEITTGNLSITKTSGNSTADGTYAKYGNIVMINVHISTTGTTASGSNIFVGSISTFSPVINTSIVGYASAKPIIASFGTTGGITIRNASPEVVGNNSSINIRGTFIVE